ncbi:hypothetical protein [Marinitoga lauensis]|nr:hypothetical protein [Marinitoga lauensis]
MLNIRYNERILRYMILDIGENIEAISPNIRNNTKSKGIMCLNENAFLE